MMNPRVSVLVGLLVFLAICLSNVGDARCDIVNFTFEGDTVGSMPADWSEASGYDGNTVTAYVTDTTAGAGTKSFYMDDWAGASQLSMRTSFSNQSSGLYQLTGMARVEQNNVSLNPFGLLGSGNARYNSLEFDSGGNFAYEDGHGNYVDTGVAYQTGKWYDFEFFINMDTNRWSVSIDHELGTEVLSASDLQFGTSYPSSFYQIRSWGVGSSGTGQWYIDNVQLSQVPEPATLAALLSMGVMGLIGCAWRRRKAT